MLFPNMVDMSLVESLFDFDNTKTLVLLFLIKLLSVSEMNLTPKAKVSLKMLKIQHPVGRFESHMKKIRISIPKSFFNSEKVKFGLVILIIKGVIQIPNVKVADKS